MEIHRKPNRSKCGPTVVIVGKVYWITAFLISHVTC